MNDVVKDSNKDRRHQLAEIELVSTIANSTAVNKEIKTHAEKILTQYLTMLEHRIKGN